MLQPIRTNVAAVILAAGRGTRLNSTDRPKVMLEIGGRPMVSYTVETLQSIGLPKDRIVLVVGFHQEKVREYFGDAVSYADQDKQLGTAHAAYIGMKMLPADIKHVLVMGGDDSAFYRGETLRSLIDTHIQSGAVISLLSVKPAHPEKLGRIVRHADGRIEMVEKEYLSEEQKNIREISTGTFIVSRSWFEDMFPRMPKMKKLGEYGLPTAWNMARDARRSCHIMKLNDSSEWFGVNTSEELKEADGRKREI